MKIQVNTAHGIHGSKEFNTWIEEILTNDFSRFKDRITRLEVHFHDENAAKGGAADKSCMIEARLAGKKPIAVNHSADSEALAVTGATHKMLHRLESILDRQSHHV